MNSNKLKNCSNSSIIIQFGAIILVNAYYGYREFFISVLYNHKKNNIYNKKINDKHKIIVDKYKVYRYNEFNDNR